VPCIVFQLSRMTISSGYSAAGSLLRAQEGTESACKASGEVFYLPRPSAQIEYVEISEGLRCLVEVGELIEVEV